MPFNTFHHARISGISVVVPKTEIKLEDELEYYGGSLKKVERTKKIVGLSARRVADEGVTAADLCQQAAENMFEGMGFDRSNIDALIFVSQSPDYAIPATACVLQDKLGLPKSVAAFDVNQGCTAYVYGLWLGSSLLESGACKHILLLVGESDSRRTDKANRVVAPVFGDCGSATLLEYREQSTPSFFSLGTDGSGAEALIMPAGHARIPLPLHAPDYARLVEPIADANGNPWYLSRVFMDGGAIFNFTMEVVPPHLRELLAYAQKAPNDIDWLVLHQANKQIAQSVATQAGFPLEKAPTETVSKYGNQAGASLPSVVCDQLCDKIQDNKQRVLMAGYGVGLSWASTVLELDHIWCSGIRDFSRPDNLPTEAQLEAHWREKFANNGSKGE